MYICVYYCELIRRGVKTLKQCNSKKKKHLFREFLDHHRFRVPYCCRVLLGVITPMLP